MRKTCQVFLPLLILILTLTGCGLESVAMPKLPEIELGKTSLAGTVEYVNGRTCRIRIVEGDGHFDEDDVIQVSYTSLEGSKSVVIGNTVRFEYDYTAQVSELLGYPHISVNQMSVE